MPVGLRKLTPEETQRYFPGRGVRLPKAEYIEALRGLKAGDVVEVVRGDVTSRAFKHRLTLAAKHLGLSLKFARTPSKEAVRFQVREVRASHPAASAGTTRRLDRSPRRTRPG